MTIANFACKETENLWLTGSSRRFNQIAAPAYRRLQMLDAATNLSDLRIPPGNQLEKLKGDLDGYYSIRINRQWRLVFSWHGDQARDVRIADYHD